MPWPMALYHVMSLVGVIARAGPDAQLLGVGARLVAAADEDGLGVHDRLEGVLGRRHAGDLGRVILRADDDEVVVHHVEALLGVAVGHELVLGGAGVDQQHVGVALAPISMAWPVPTATTSTLHVVGLLEDGQDGVEQAGVGGAGGGGQAQQARAGRLGRGERRRRRDGGAEVGAAGGVVGFAGATVGATVGAGTGVAVGAGALEQAASIAIKDSTSSSLTMVFTVFLQAKRLGVSDPGVRTVWTVAGRFPPRATKPPGDARLISQPRRSPARLAEPCAPGRTV